MTTGMTLMLSMVSSPIQMESIVPMNVNLPWTTSQESMFSMLLS